MAGLFFLAAPTLLKLHRYGWQAADYSHAYFVLTAAVFLFWRQRKHFVAAEGFRFGPSLLFASGLCGYAFGALQDFMVIEAISLVVVLWALVFLRFDVSSARRLVFPLAYLLFLVPPPLWAIDVLTWPLKRMSAQASGLLLSLAGVPVFVFGVVIKAGGHSLFVSDACSGFRSLVALLSLSAVYAYLQPLSNAAKWTLFLGTIPIAIFANIMRLTLTGYLAYRFGQGAAEGFFHSVSGLAVFLLGIGTLAAFSALLGRFQGATHEGTS